MKSLTKYIIETKELNTDNLLYEGRIANMTDVAWLNDLYCNSIYAKGTYIQNAGWGAADNEYALYGVFSKDANDWKAKLKENKGIKGIKSKKNRYDYSIIYFTYDKNKDTQRLEAINGEAEKERKEAEKFNDEVKNTDLTKYTATEKDIQKMKDYFNKRSNPERLVKSIKDNNKLISRWLAAIKIDWKDAISEFAYAIESRKLMSKAEMVAYSNKYKNELVDISDLNVEDKNEEKLRTSWITKSVYKFFKSLKDYNIKFVEAWKNAKTSAGKNIMSKNGRAWTEGFTVEVDHDGDTKQITFDIVTNEGGGLYGYVLQNEGRLINLKQFKEHFQSLIK